VYHEKRLSNDRMAQPGFPRGIFSRYYFRIGDSHSLQQLIIFPYMIFAVIFSKKTSPTTA
jgi:hypothetical protein